MKKIFSIIAVCAMTVAANAQIVSSSSRGLVAEEFPNYSRIFVSYSPMTFSGNASKGEDNPFNETAGGVTLGWLGGWSVSKTMPLYIEGGLNIKYNHWSDEFTDGEGDSDSYYSYSEKYKSSMTFLSLNVPINISYNYSIPGVDGLSIAPYIGLHLTGNIIGSCKYEWEWESYRNGKLSDSDSGDSDYSFFDEDDMKEFSDGYSDDTASRLQIGWQIGVGINYKKLYLGVGYSSEFTEYMKKLNTGGLTLTLGLNL